MSRLDYQPNYQQEANLYLAALAALPGLGPKRLSKLQAQIGNWQACWEADISLWQAAKMPLLSQTAWQKNKKTFQPELLQEALNKTNTFLITQKHPEYPSSFKDLDDAPLLLYARGHWPKNKKIISVIGSRQPSPYGEATAIKFIPSLIRANYSIASGLALGLDSQAHSLSLKNNGHTIAILGSGLDNIYPSLNQKLAEDIVKSGGLLLSEYHLKASALPSNFIQRNRLLAAISEITLILEAGLNSGSLRTATIAKKLSRKVYAVPGNIFNDKARGCHRLIQNGAYLAHEPQDIIGDNQPELRPIIAKEYLSLDEKMIIKFLQSNFFIFSGASADKISTELQLDSSSVNSKLSILEMKKLICQRQGRYYYLPTNK